MKDSSSKGGRALGLAAVALLVGGAGLASLAASGCDPTVTFGSLDDDGTSTSGSTASGSNPQNGPSCIDLVADVGEDVSGLIEHEGWLYFVEVHHTNPEVDLEVLSDILRVPVVGGTPEIIAEDVSRVGVLKARGERLYWTERKGALRSSALDGTDVQTLHQAAPNEWGLSLALSEDSAFVGETDGSILRLPLEGGVVTELRAATPDTDALRLQVGGEKLYFMDSHFGSTDIQSMSIDGGASTLLFPGTLHLSDILLDGDYLYFSDLGAWMESSGPGTLATGVGTIQRIDLTGATEVVSLAEEQPFPWSLTLDESGLYWGGGSAPVDLADIGSEALVHVQRVRDASSAVQPVSPPSVVYSLTSCDHAICWVNSATQKIERYRECVP